MLLPERQDDAPIYFMMNDQPDTCGYCGSRLEFLEMKEIDGERVFVTNAWVASAKSNGRKLNGPRCGPFFIRRVNSLSLVINLSSLLNKLHRLNFHPLFQRSLFVHALRGSKVAHVLADLHRAELRAAHGAEVGDLGGILGQGISVVAA